MRIIKVIIECGDSKSFAAYTEAQFDGFSIAGYGFTAEEAKNDFIEAYNEAREMFNCPELSFEWQYDVKSFLQLYKNKLSLSGLQTLTGINQKQLGHYLSGVRKPSDATKSKIITGVHRFADDLNKIALV